MRAPSTWRRDVLGRPSDFCPTSQGMRAGFAVLHSTVLILRCDISWHAGWPSAFREEAHETAGVHHASRWCGSVTDCLAARGARGCHGGTVSDRRQFLRSRPKGWRVLVCHLASCKPLGGRRPHRRVTIGQNPWVTGWQGSTVSPLPFLESKHSSVSTLRSPNFAPQAQK
jgi:hypothetical protein